MMPSVRQASFGTMLEYDFDLPLSNKFEVMHFEKSGKPHEHDQIEIAVCISGDGIVLVEDKTYEVAPGDSVIIPPGATHWMEPAKSDVTMVMIILYHGQQDNVWCNCKD